MWLTGMSCDLTWGPRSLTFSYKRKLRLLSFLPENIYFINILCNMFIPLFHLIIIYYLFIIYSIFTTFIHFSHFTFRPHVYDYIFHTSFIPLYGFVCIILPV